jgi:uncharacterized membrane protein YhaH (DUF805 family)
MYCENCGKNISKESQFCRFCGKEAKGSEAEIKKSDISKNSYLNRLFRTGRLNRRNFIIGMLLTFTLWIIFLMILGYVMRYIGIYNDQSANWVLYGTYIVVIFYWLSIEIRRLHDLGYSGWYFLANFIPIAGAILYIYLIFVSGKKESNKYGGITEPKFDVYEIFGVLNK